MLIKNEKLIKMTKLGDKNDIKIRITWMEKNFIGRFRDAQYIIKNDSLYIYLNVKFRQEYRTTTQVAYRIALLCTPEGMFLFLNFVYTLLCSYSRYSLM